MKLIQCIIRQEKLNDVVEKLMSVTSGLTIFDALGHGHQKCQSGVYRGVEYQLTLQPKVMIEIAADDNKVEELIRILVETARTGHVGDGRIFILPVEETYHVRTGFMD
jgi:nitrogen regulatory protein P-II 1